jgi:hypothetical protein
VGPDRRGREPVRTAEHHADAPRVRRVARAHAVLPRPALRGAEQRSRDRRRIHRPPDDGPPLVGRPAPGRRSEGTRQDPEREPDARVDHVPELLPHVREAVRHDRHGRHRSVRIQRDLRPGNSRDPDQPPAQRKDKQDQIYKTAKEKLRRRHSRHPRLRRTWPAGAGRHDVDRKLRAAVGPAEEGRFAARSAERQAARARSEIVAEAGRPKRVTIATNMAGRGTDIVLGGNVEKQARLSRPTNYPVGREGTPHPASCTTNGRRCTIR